MIKLTDLLKEIKVNKPGFGFYFEVIDDGYGIEYRDNRARTYYYAPYDEEDEYIIFNLGIENATYDDMEEGDPNNPQGFINYIADLDPDFNINEFKSFIDNLKKAKIPIEELDMIGDGGDVYVNVAIKSSNVKPYIKTK